MNKDSSTSQLFILETKIDRLTQKVDELLNKLNGGNL